ncbi:citron-like protein [Gorgonomyces haynaldii]|nr:citron-like protein [Gorgonomyces haynaldii]
MKETKGCEFYSLVRTKQSLFLCISMPKTVTIMKWAPHPFNKFMKLKDIHVDFKPTLMNMAESDTGEVRLFMDTHGGIRMYDFQNATIEDLQAPSLTQEQLGKPVQSVTLGEYVVHCFENSGLVQPLGFQDKKTILTWRHPMTFASKISDDYIVAGSQSVVDVINSHTGKIVHVFETKKDKIKQLGLLTSRDSTLYLLAEEERDGVKTCAIILVELQ